MTPQYTNTILEADVDGMTTDVVSATDFLKMANKACIDVLSEIDLRSAIRRTPLAPNLFDDIFEYTAPTDLKADKIIDIQPQVKRGRFDEWVLVDPQEFDRKKEDRRVDRFGDPIVLKNTQWLGDNLCAVSSYDFLRKVLVSRPVDDDEIVISEFDALGDWVAFGDAENIEVNSDDYVKGSRSLQYDISSAGGTTAGIQNSLVDAVDITLYLGTGSVFIWAFLTSKTNVTNFKFKVGNSSGDYYLMTATTDHAGNVFQNGWNLLRFDLSGKSTTGSPDETACTYFSIYMTKAGAKISEQAYRFDWLVFKRGEHFYLHYYSKYGWQTAAGVYIEKSTTGTDLLNVDTDEYNLILSKTAEYCERYILKNSAEADLRKREYEESKRIYKLENPSRALLLTQNYFMR